MFKVEVFDVLFDLVRAGEVALGGLPNAILREERGDTISLLPYCITVFRNYPRRNPSINPNRNRSTPPRIKRFADSLNNSKRSTIIINIMGTRRTFIPANISQKDETALVPVCAIEDGVYCGASARLEAGNNRHDVRALWAHHIPRREHGAIRRWQPLSGPNSADWRLSFYPFAFEVRL
jgi:hypothetical protein